MSDRAERRKSLRDQVIWRERGGCAHPGCLATGSQMAHIRGVGMGGRPSADTLENVLWLCVSHHDVLDGREHHGLRRVMGDLYAEIIRLRVLVKDRSL